MDANPTDALSALVTEHVDPGDTDMLMEFLSSGMADPKLTLLNFTHSGVPCPKLNTVTMSKIMRGFASSCSICHLVADPCKVCIPKATFIDETKRLAARALALGYKDKYPSLFYKCSTRSPGTRHKCNGWITKESDRLRIPTLSDYNRVRCFPPETLEAYNGFQLMHPNCSSSLRHFLKLIVAYLEESAAIHMHASNN